MKTKVLIIILAFISTFTFAQRNVADKFFKKYSYIKAIELYKEALKNGDDSEHVLTRLGDCYYNNSNSEKAANWYHKALQKYPKINPEYIYKYIQTQRSLGNYEETKTWLAKFNEVQSRDSHNNSIVSDLSIYDELSSTDRVCVDIKNLDLNTPYSDFGGYENNNRLFFASARSETNIYGKKSYGWNGQPFLDLYQASITINNDVKELSNGKFINAIGINTIYHEAAVAITNDGKTIYFTRDNVDKRNKLDYDKEGTSHLKIYKATLENETWKNSVSLDFNDDVFSTGHPALSADNKQLYFVSDREHPDAIGQTDIYVVDIYAGNQYSEPRNLGSSINTEGREMFPYIAKDSTLYFSSDGYLNLGLLDIYKSNLLKDPEVTVKNLGAPFNSGADDFALFIDTETKTGYFSSNRIGGKGDDDIYSFSENECKQITKGIVMDLDTKEPLPNAMVELINKNGKIINTITTSSTGAYSLLVDYEKKYSLKASKPDFKDAVKSFTSAAENNYENTVDLYLKFLLKVPCEIVIDPILFDFDKWTIATDSKYELENIVNVLRDYPTMILKIESHTDSRGTDKYNNRLSEKRAKSTSDYLLSRGIDSNRIESAIGYGETQLLNKCANKVKCTDAQHQENRRSYFKIVNCDK
jgi:outer membrane protein OmpA-like peptidoglycan-associated protein